MKGMVQSLVVLESDLPEAAMPETDARILLDNYWFAITPKLTAGGRTIRVENRASQPHEVVMMRLMPGKSAEDVAKFLAQPDGAPPFEIVAGTTAIARGVVNYIVADLMPGDYLLFCFVPDVRDGRTHVEHGMIEEFQVD